MWRHSVATGLVVLTIALSGMHLGRAEAWQAQWQRTVEAAKKEGQLFIYAGDTAETLFREFFQKKYPEIRVTLGVPGGARAAPRIIAERRAGKYTTDLYITGARTLWTFYTGGHLDPIRPTLILPEVVDESNFWDAKHHYVDPEGKFYMAFELGIRQIVAYNTTLVKPSDIRSYRDLLHPKWKGKIVGYDPRLPRGSEAVMFFYNHPALGYDFLVRLLRETDIIISRDDRQIVDWLALGKAAFAIFSGVTTLRIPEAKEQGLPVDWFPPGHLNEGEILGSGAGVVALLNRAPHPNAAKVALNWLLSREGQLAYQKIFPSQESVRIDIPKDDVRSAVRRVPGIKYVKTITPEYLDFDPVRGLIDKALRIQ